MFFPEYEGKASVVTREEKHVNTEAMKAFYKPACARIDKIKVGAVKTLDTLILTPLARN